MTASQRAQAAQLLAEARTLATRSARIAQLASELLDELLDSDDDDSPQLTVVIQGDRK